MTKGIVTITLSPVLALSKSECTQIDVVVVVEEEEDKSTVVFLYYTHYQVARRKQEEQKCHLASLQ